MCNRMSSKECIFTGKKVLPNSNVQWNVFKGVYFYWEKSTPQFKIELISGEYFFPCGSKFFPGKYYSGSTFSLGNYYSGSNFFQGVIIYGYTGRAFFITGVPKIIRTQTTRACMEYKQKSPINHITV